jgi:hypothetical protein
MTHSSIEVTETGPQLGGVSQQLASSVESNPSRKNLKFLGKKREPVIDNWVDHEFTTTTVPRLPGGKHWF